MSEWTPVVLRKTMTKKPTTEHAIAQAKANGQIETVAREPNKAASIANAKLDSNDITDFRQPTVTLEFKLALAKARQAKGLSQADLAKQINCPAKSIQDFESGKAVPTGPTISLLNRKLGTVLPKIPKIKKEKIDLDAN